MKSHLLLLLSVVICNLSFSQNIGIGTKTPSTRLEVVGFSTGQVAVMQLIQTSTGHGIRSNIQSATPVNLGNPSAIVGDATSGTGIAGTASTGTGVFGYSVSGVGVFGTSTSNDAVRGFCTGSGAGGEFYNSSGGPALLTGNGNVGIGVAVPVNKLDASGATGTVGNFVNTVSGADYIGLTSSCNNTPFYGYGIQGEGGYVGVQGASLLAGSGDRFGLRGYGSNGNINYGIFAKGSGGSTSYGIYAEAGGGTAANYAGYFSGNVYTSGTYSPSDRKLKNNIHQLNNALSMIAKLNPSVYFYRTEEFKQMKLPGGVQYGLIADEVKQVLPTAVIKAVQPGEYKDHNEKGKKVKDEVEFDAVNYTQLIPVLIGAIKEQQSIINNQDKKIDELEKRLSVVEKKQ